MVEKDNVEKTERKIEREAKNKDARLNLYLEHVSVFFDFVCIFECDLSMKLALLLCFCYLFRI